MRTAVANRLQPVRDRDDLDLLGHGPVSSVNGRIVPRGGIARRKRPIDQNTHGGRERADISCRATSRTAAISIALTPSSASSDSDPAQESLSDGGGSLFTLPGLALDATRLDRLIRFRFGLS
jgi:hypothetical protein